MNKKVTNRPIVIDEPIETEPLRFRPQRRNGLRDWPLFGVPRVMIDHSPELLQLPDSEPEKRRKPVDSRDALADAAYRASTTPETRRRLTRARGQSIVVTVPGPEWVAPICGLLSGVLEASVYARDGSDRKQTPTAGNDAVATALGEGKNVLGISHAPERVLPDLLVASADISLTISPPDGRTIADAMRRCLRGRIPADVPADLGAGLDFETIVAALRHGSTPAQAVARLQALSTRRAAASANRALPRLEDCGFYGAAQVWALALAKDIEDARRGIIDFSACDRACLVHGIPGTGKTAYAKIVASACRLPVFELSMGELFATSSGYLDGIIKAMRAVFAKAAASKPCILFLDEVDAIPNRMTLNSRNQDYWMPIVNDFLMLVADAVPGIFIIASTNRIEAIDPALLRPGRLERVIEIKPPSTAENLASVMRFHLGTDLPDADLVELARIGLGATPAIVMDWVRSARRSARTANRDMTVADIFAAIAPPDDRPRDLLKINSLHEAGHAVAVIVLGIERIGFVSLVRDSISNGRLTMATAADSSRIDRERLEKQVIMLLTGRAAEIVILGRPTVGSGGNDMSDLGRATRLVAGIHASLGLGEHLVYRAPFDKADDPLEYDHQLRALVESELRRMQAAAEEIVRQHRPAVEAIADALVAKRFLDGSEVEALFEAASGKPASRPTDRADVAMIAGLPALVSASDQSEEPNVLRETERAG